MNFSALLMHSNLLVLSRVLLATILMASAYGKLRHYTNFASLVDSYRLLPKPFVRPFAIVLPWIEAILSIMLFLGWQTRFFGTLNALLFSIFILAVGINLGRSRWDLECGCFGAHNREKISLKVITRNLFLLMISIQLSLLGGGLLAFDQLPMVTQGLIINTYFIGMLLPLSLTISSLYQLARLIRQLARLVSLAPVEVKQ